MVWLPYCFGQPAESQSSMRVRYDAHHAHTWLEAVPRPGLSDYHLLHGSARGAEALRGLGWDCDAQLSAWTTEALRDVDLVVIPLVSADRYPFLVAEIEALRRYLESGGGVLIMTDHTNCYFHNHVLGSLFHELGLSLTNHLVCEPEPRNLSSGNGWIQIEDFTQHPVTQGLNSIAFQSGGSVDKRSAIARSSPTSWGDEGRTPPFGEGADIGFYGDFVQQPNETSGPIGVVAAKTIGRGRVVVIADQNCVGGMFLNYADNRRLWLQAAAWAAMGETSDETAAIIGDRGLASETDRSLIWCWEPLHDHRIFWGNTGPDGLYHAFARWNKYADARATDRSISDSSWLIIPEVACIDHSKDRAEIENYLLRKQRRAILLGAPEDNVRVAQWMQSMDGLAIDRNSPDWDLMFQLPSGSEVYWLARRSQWTNSVVAKPEGNLSETLLQRERQGMEWMWALGLKRVQAVDEMILWPED